MSHDSKILVHLESSHASIYRLDDAGLAFLEQRGANFDPGLPLRDLADAVVGLCDGLEDFADVIDNTNTRLYATEPFRRLPEADQASLVNTVFVDSGLLLNVVAQDLEHFYTQASGSSGVEGDMMAGVVRQELRKVVVCGSFQQSLSYIEDVIDRLRRTGAEVLSPASTKIKPGTEDTDFILFDYQDFLKNERDTWRHKYDHMNAFRQADAVVLCNPEGRIGQGTVFEIGFMAAISKRIILTEKPAGISVVFPCEVGLNN